MISRAEMVSQESIDNRLPILSDSQIQRVLIAKIEIVARDTVSKKAHIFGYLDDWQRSLYSITAEEYSVLEGIGWREKRMGRVKADNLQVIGLEVMKQYGLNEDISKPRYTKRGWDEEGIMHDGNGIFRELRAYPSQAINGLSFLRERRFEKYTHKELSVGWSVVDDVSLFGVIFGKKKK
jgi:hypothetical protein